MDLFISKMKDFQDGAFHVTAFLTSQESQAYERFPVAFQIPTLSNRIFRFLPPYCMAVILPDKKVERRGIFYRGAWFADFYTNGIPEKENPTSVATVQQALSYNINEALHLARE